MEGIIATTVNGKKDDIKAVRNLACEYVKNPNAIILLTVTCESEFHFWHPLNDRYNTLNCCD